MTFEVVVEADDEAEAIRLGLDIEVNENTVIGNNIIKDSIKVELYEEE